MSEHLINPFHGLLIQLSHSLPLLLLSRTPPGAMIMIDKVSSSLYTRISQLTYFFRVVAIPSPATKLIVKVKNELCMDEIHKSVSHVTGVEMVDGQIQEVYAVFVVTPYLLVQHFFGILVWNVTDHQSGPAVRLNLPIYKWYLVQRYRVLLALFAWSSIPTLLLLRESRI